MVRLIQINTDRARVVTDELRALQKSTRWAVAAVQEPYSARNCVCGFGNMRVYVGTGDGPPMAAVVVADERVAATLLSQYSDRNTVVVSLEYCNRVVYCVSMYCQFSDRIEPYIDKIDVICRALRGKDIIVCMDSNAKSQLWHSNTFADEAGRAVAHRRAAWERGELLEDCILHNELVVLNRESEVPSYRGVARGAMSNIDVTLATPGLARRVGGWVIQEEGTSSQHSMISMELHGGKPAHVSKDKRRYDERRADWDKYVELTEQKLWAIEYPASVTTAEQLTGLVRRVEEVLVEAANLSIPRKSTRATALSWWTPRLEGRWRRVLRLRHRIQRAGARSTPQQRQEFQLERRKYTHEARKARRSDWRNFVTQEGQGNPWGAPYRIVRAQNDPFVLSTLQGGTAVDWMGAAGELLAALFPDDDETNETTAQQEVRRRVREATARPLTSESVSLDWITDGLLGSLVRSFKPGKSPGLDSIEVRMLQKAWHLVYPWYGLIVRSCVQLGIFPRHWKCGRVCVLRKGNNRNPGDPKAYRPLCLLSVPGKLLEKVIVEGLRSVFHLGSLHQHGFTRGRSTVTAIERLHAEVAASNSKYMIGIFVDIRGAFDNVWWPGVLDVLRERECAVSLYKLMCDYFKDRSVVYIEGNQAQTKWISKGCPQGSVLGPQLWNLVFDGVLRVLECLGVPVIAYADDLAILVEGNSRRALEERGSEVMEALLAECKSLKLEVAAEKTVVMMLKGMFRDRSTRGYNTVHPHYPAVRVGGTSFKFVTSFKYLGITYMERLRLTNHIDIVGQRAINAFMAVCRLAGSEWGIRYEELVTVYKGLFRSILLYGMQALAPHLTKTQWARLESFDRRALLKVSRAYRTAPKSALPVIAGVMPVQLEAWWRHAKYSLTRRRPVIIPGIYDGTGCTETATEQSRSIKTAILERWQRDWDEADTGRLAYRFLPGVRDRLDKTWIVPRHEWVQFVLGHGEFASYLTRFGLREGQQCACGADEETPEHLLEQCPTYRELREQWGIGPITQTFVGQEGLWRLQQFALCLLPMLAARHHPRQS